MIVYIIVGYSVFILLTLFAAFSKCFDANLFQRFSLGILAVWSYWRINIVIDEGIAWPHEPVLITGMLIFSLATVFQVKPWREKWN